MPKRIECDIEQLRSLYFDSHMSCAEVAEAVGWGRGRLYLVHRKLREAGYAMRPPGGRKRPLPEAEMCRLYADDECNSEEVATRVGCSPTQVRRVLKRHGVTRPRGASTKNRRGEKSPSWKGGRVVLPQGYVAIWKPDHPQANKNGYVLEHRMVASDALGIRLTPKDEVHHINGVKDDNRPENLIVVPRGKHQKMHAEIIRELYQLRRDLERMASVAGPPAAWRFAGIHHCADWRVVG